MRTGFGDFSGCLTNYGNMIIACTTDCPDELTALLMAVRRRFGDKVQIENVARPTLGGVNRTIVFDCADGASSRRLVSREVTYDDTPTPFLRPDQQFAVMQAAYSSGFPVPEPVFVYDSQDAMNDGYVTAFAPGETMPNRILKDQKFAGARRRFARQAGALLAQLHAMSPLRFDMLESRPESHDPVATLRDLFDQFAEPHPAIELGLRWLDQNRPPSERRVLLHGDFRLGNLMMNAEGITAVLDWECAHIGDPSEDLGWLCTRSWRFGNVDLPVAGIAEYEDLLAAYEASGGERVTKEELRFWEVFGLVRWAVINVMQAYGHVHGSRRGVSYAAMGRNTSLIEYELLMTLSGHFE